MSSKYNLKTAYILSSVAVLTGTIGFAKTLEDMNILHNNKSLSESNTIVKGETKENNSNSLVEVSNEDFDGNKFDYDELEKLVTQAKSEGKSVYKGQLPKTNSTYADSRNSPTKVTTGNWKKMESAYYADSNDSDKLYKSGKLLLFGIYDNKTDIKNETLTIEGWSSVINHTHVDGKNNKTYLVMQNGTDVQIFEGVNQPSDLTEAWIWNKSDPSLRCREQTSDLDKPIGWQADGGTSKTQYKGCYHDNKNIAFKVSVPLENLFGAGNQNKNYSMYVVNSTGSNKIIYKPLVSNLTKKQSYSGQSNAGQVTYDAGATQNTVSIKESGDVTIRDNIYGNTAPNPIKRITHTVKDRETLWGIANKYGSTVDAVKKLNNLKSDTIYGGQKLQVDSSNAPVGPLPTFPKGAYTVLNRREYKGVIYYEIKGQGVQGWVPSNYVVDKGTAAVLKYSVTSQNFNLNFRNKDNLNSKIQPSLVRTVNSQTSSSVSATDYLEINTNKKYYRIVEGGTQTRTFNTNSHPPDINLDYDDAVPFKVEYRDTSTGKIVRTDNPIASAGKPERVLASANASFAVGDINYVVTKTVDTIKDFKKGINLADYNKLSDTVTVNVESSQKFNVNYLHKDNNSKLATSTAQELKYNSPTFTIGADDNLELQSGGNSYYRIFDGIQSRSYKLGSSQADINLFYDNSVDFKVEYRDVLTGKIVKTDNESVLAGVPKVIRKDKHSEFTVGSEKYRIENAVNVTKDFKKGITLADYNNLKNTIIVNVESSQSLKINYLYEDDKKTEVANSKPIDLFVTSPELKVGTQEYLELQFKDNKYFRIVDGIPTRKFDSAVKPTDINLFYDNSVDFKVVYRYKGKTVKTDNEHVLAGVPKSITAKKHSQFNIGSDIYRYLEDVNVTKDFKKGITLTEYNALKNTVVINVEKKETVNLTINHNAVDVNNELLSNLESETIKVQQFPSEGNKSYKVVAKGFGIPKPFENIDVRNKDMVSGKWFFSGRGIDSDKNIQSNPKGNDPVNKGYENMIVSTDTVGKSVTFNYMKEQDNPNNTVQDAENVPLEVNGQFNWFLTKPNNTTSVNHKESYAEFNNAVDITGDSYARRNGKSSIKVNNALIGKDINDTNIYYSTSTLSRKVPKLKGFGIVDDSKNKTNQKTAENNTIVPAPRKDSDFMNIYAEEDFSKLEDKNKTKELKGKDVLQEYGFEYSNKFTDIYKAADGYNVGGKVFMYEYTHTNTVWTGSTKVDIKTDATNKLDHKLGETITLGKGQTVNSTTGRKAELPVNLTSSKSVTTEIVQESISENSLIKKTAKKTQSHVDIKGNLTYKSDFKLNQGKKFTNFDNKTFVYYSKGENNYLVKDVDANFRNSSDEDGISKFTSTDMGKISTKAKDLAKDSKFKIDINADSEYKASGTSDVTVVTNNEYYVLKNSGMLVESKGKMPIKPIDDPSKSTAENKDMQDKYKEALKDFQNNLNFKAGKDYESYYKVAKDTNDGVKHDTPIGNRYYIPVDENSTIKPKQTYINTYILDSVGLNDSEVVLQDTFKFDKYIVGDVMTDKSVLNTQKAPIDKSVEYKGKVVLTPETKNEVKSLRKEIKVSESEHAKPRTEKSATVRTTDSNRLWDKLTSIFKK